MSYCYLEAVIESDLEGGKLKTFLVEGPLEGEQPSGSMIAHLGDRVWTMDERGIWMEKGSDLKWYLYRVGVPRKYLCKKRKVWIPPEGDSREVKHYKPLWA